VLDPHQRHLRCYCLRRSNTWAIS